MPRKTLQPHGLSRRYEEIMSRLAATAKDSILLAEQELEALTRDADRARLPFVSPPRAALVEHVLRSVRSMGEISDDASEAPSEAEVDDGGSEQEDASSEEEPSEC